MRFTHQLSDVQADLTLDAISQGLSQVDLPEDVTSERVLGEIFLQAGRSDLVAIHAQGYPELCPEAASKLGGKDMVSALASDCLNAAVAEQYSSYLADRFALDWTDVYGDAVSMLTPEGQESAEIWAKICMLEQGKDGNPLDYSRDIFAGISDFAYLADPASGYDSMDVFDRLSKIEALAVGREFYQDEPKDEWVADIVSERGMSGKRFVLQNAFPTPDGKGYLTQFSFANDLPQKDGSYLAETACSKTLMKQSDGISRTNLALYYPKECIDLIQAVANHDGDKPVFQAQSFVKHGATVIDTLAESVSPEFD